MEKENERLAESERQTAAELAQRLVDIATKGQAAQQTLVEQELLQVRGLIHMCILVYFNLNLYICMFLGIWQVEVCTG